MRVVLESKQDLFLSVDVFRLVELNDVLLIQCFYCVQSLTLLVLDQENRAKGPLSNGFDEFILFDAWFLRLYHCKIIINRGLSV